MDYRININMKKEILEDVLSLGKKCEINRIILFGSRARGDHKERSDIDLAIQGGNTTMFAVEIEEQVRTLLLFDVVDLDGIVSEELRGSIKREGIILYEKTR